MIDREIVVNYQTNVVCFLYVYYSNTSRRLLEVTWLDGPFTEENRKHRVGVKSYQYKTDHCDPGKLPRFPKFFKSIPTQEVETKSQYSIKDYIDYKPDYDQIHNGHNYTALRLLHVLERPITKKHVLPDPHQNHHGEIHNKRIGKLQIVK